MFFTAIKPVEIVDMGCVAKFAKTFAPAGVSPVR